MVGKATSEGTKACPINATLIPKKPEKRLTSPLLQVTPSDAPTYREGAGAVAPDSLAAESVHAGGAFATNRNVSAPSSTTANTHDPASTQPHKTPHQQAAAAAAAHSSQGVPAPTYVQTTVASSRGGDASRPHGNNVREDPELTGRPGKFDVELGSKQDPGREAEKSFGRRQVGGAPGGGNGSAEQPYEVLGRETDA